MNGHVTERAAKFAEKLRPPKETDNRSTDEKMAEFMKTYMPSYRENMKDAHQKKRDK